MSRLRRVWVAMLSLLVSIALAPVAMAHEVRPAYLEIKERAPNRFEVLWKQPSQSDLVLRLEPMLSNGLLDDPPDQQYSTGSFVIRKWRARPLVRGTFDGATLRIEGLERTLTDALVSIRFANGQQIQELLKPASPELTIRLAGTGKLAVPAYLSLGVEHILTGFDHLSFVLGLMLLVQGGVRLVKTITVFTLAHSITLAAAAVGFVKTNAPVIEALVALSIVFVAVELTRSSPDRQSMTSRYPWLIAFVFGLMHGFAFAGSLVDIGLPEHNIPGALLLFNIGVEIGQLLFVSMVLALIALVRRWHWGQVKVYPRWVAAYGIGTLASYWTFERMGMFFR